MARKQLEEGERREGERRRLPWLGVEPLGRGELPLGRRESLGCSDGRMVRLAETLQPVR